MRPAGSEAACWLLVLALAGCGGGDGGSPIGPGPGPGPQPGPANQPPVIDGVAVSTQRVEADTEVTVTATVRDVETPVEALRFDWTADAGTFAGTGPTVRCCSSGSCWCSRACSW